MGTQWALGDLEHNEEAQTLALLIRETDRGLIAFALYRSVADREAAVRFLRERTSCPVVEFVLSKTSADPVRLLQTVPDSPRQCVFFYDVEEALPRLAGYVNLQREAFAKVPHAVVFWVREPGLREIAEKAPDFWAWRSGVFDFRSESRDMPVSAMRAAFLDEFDFKDRGDLGRRISLYKGLLEEYSGQEKPDERFLAGLELKLVQALHTLAQFAEAEEYAERALERARRMGDSALETSAQVALGNVRLEQLRFDDAEGCFRAALEKSEQSGDESVVAGVSHNLGMIAEERQRFDEAEVCHRKALEIYEHLGLERNAASGYHHLGIIAQERQRFDEAEEWYRKSLEIKERLGLERDAAWGYHQLGIIAQERQRFDEAEEWYRKSLEIKERLGLERDAASDYYHLGRIAQERQRFDEAEEWYRKALEINERLGLERYTAYDYHQLGMIAEKRQRFDDAEQWYRKALEISERLGLERYAAIDYHQLGIIAQLRQRFDEAEQWYRKALEIYERLRHPPLLVNTLAQYGVLCHERGRHAEAVGWLGKALRIAAEYKMQVAGQILAVLAGALAEMTEEEFTAAWREAVPDMDPPMDALREAVQEMRKQKP